MKPALLHRPTGFHQRESSLSALATGTLANIQFTSDLHPRDRGGPNPVNIGIPARLFTRSCFDSSVCQHRGSETLPQRPALPVDTAAKVSGRKFWLDVSVFVKINLSTRRACLGGSRHFTHFKSWGRGKTWIFKSAVNLPKNRKRFLKMQLQKFEKEKKKTLKELCSLIPLCFYEWIASVVITDATHADNSIHCQMDY